MIPCSSSFSCSSSSIFCLRVLGIFSASTFPPLFLARATSLCAGPRPLLGDVFCDSSRLRPGGNLINGRNWQELSPRNRVSAGPRCGFGETQLSVFGPHALYPFAIDHAPSNDRAPPCLCRL